MKDWDGKSLNCSIIVGRKTSLSVITLFDSHGKFLHLFPHRCDLLFKSDAAKDLICGEYDCSNDLLINNRYIFGIV